MMRTILHSDNARDDGFTLIELLVGMMMALLVTAAAVTFLISIMHRQPKTTSSADVIGSARNAVEKITADLRVGKSATLSQPYELKVTASCAQVGSGAEGDCEVAYRCGQETGKTTYGCTRSVSDDPAESDGPSETVISGLASDKEVFCVYPMLEPANELESNRECGLQDPGKEPLYVGVKVELPNYEASEGNMVLEGGAALHNALLER
jgi:prepilin-type N-terminal cleavage/methylation domain-containing protein